VCAQSARHVIPVFAVDPYQESSGWDVPVNSTSGWNVASAQVVDQMSTGLTRCLVKSAARCTTSEPFHVTDEGSSLAPEVSAMWPHGCDKRGGSSCSTSQHRLRKDLGYTRPMPRPCPVMNHHLSRNDQQTGHDVYRRAKKKRSLRSLNTLIITHRRSPKSPCVGPIIRVFRN